MPTPGGSGKKGTIKHDIKKVNGLYEAEGKWVDRIGEKSGNSITWLLKNKEEHPITIRIHNFSQSNPCPVKFGSSSDCWAEQTVPGRATAAFHAKATLPGDYTYEIRVSDGGGNSNAIDPELQIDGHSFRKKAVIIAAIAAVVAALIYFLF